MRRVEPKSPLTIIAILAGIIEASALASLPFLSEDSQSTYTWFLVGFPFFLTVLFFLTLNFNNKSLYSPPRAEAPCSPANNISPQSPQEPDRLTSDAAQTAEQVPTYSETIYTLGDRGITSAPMPVEAQHPPQATVTITLSGARASQVLEHFVLDALSQAQPLCNTWILYNMEAGTRTTVETQPIDR